MATRVICNDSVNPTDSATTARSTLPGSQPKTLSSATNSRCYRRRLLKRLKEKFQTQASDSNQADDPSYYGSRPTVIRVGTVSSCASSTVRSRASGGGGSWRFVDDFFRSGRSLSVASSTPTCPSTISSTKSGRSNKTIIYDDRWLEVSKPNFCTVVAVADSNDSPIAYHDGTIVTVIDEEEANVGNRCTEIDNRGSIDNQQSTTVEASTSSFEGAASAASCGNIEKVINDQNPGTSGFEPLPYRSDQYPESPSDGPSIIAASHTQSAAGPWPSHACGPDTGDADLPFNICADTNLGAPGGHRLLVPEDLPRIYPGGARWTGAMGVPIRFEEQLDEEAKGCCGNGRESQSAFVRWVVGIISVIGVSCVIVGIVLGALIVSGSTRLTLCLLMIGVGVVLVTVSAIAWRLTTFDGNGCNPDCFLSTCCLDMCGLRSAAERRRRRRAAVMLPGQFHSSVAYARVRSMRRARGGGRFACPPHPQPFPIGSCIPPEFIWRPPPPSYHASMQEERLQNLFGYRRVCEDFQNAAGSPPPTYRSHTDTNRRQSVSQIAQNCNRPVEARFGDHTSALISESEGTATTDPQFRDMATRSSADCVLPSEPIQQDEAAILVMNEQLVQQAAVAPSIEGFQNNGRPGNQAEFRVPTRTRQRGHALCPRSIPIADAYGTGTQSSTWKRHSAASNYACRHP